MTYAEALSYIHKTDWKGSVLGLERIRQLLGLLENPQKTLRFVHVAGTNGKGSVCAFVSSALSACGYKVGVFTSPFLSEFRERIRIGERLISEQELVEAVEAVRPFADSMADAPTEFELMTALAFWYFKHQKCDLVVCEVGLGGELDSTNVIESPLVSVITSIGLDHTRELGSTMEEIASAKAGIIKRGVPVVFGDPSNSAALSVIEKRAAECSAPLMLCHTEEAVLRRASLSGMVFDYGLERDVEISLVGAYQVANAAIALCALHSLRSRGLDLPQDKVRKGLRAASHKGRFEVFSELPPVIFDGAHNPDGVRALLESLDLYFPKDTRFLCVAAVMADKDYPELFSLLRPRMLRLFATSPQGHARALDAEKLASLGSELSVDSVAVPSVKEAVADCLSQAKREGVPMLVFGSLYLYREAAEELNSLPGRGF